MSDRVLVMREGRIVAEFTRAERASRKRSGAAMMGGDGAPDEAAA
jgi:rhamnose transport system ATP-binding protein